MPASIDPHSQSFTLAVIGSGAMGRGIAQLAAQANINVLLFDSNHAATESARTSIDGTLSRLVAKEKITQQQASQALARIAAVDSLAELKHADLIVEAIVEDLNIKRQLFQQLETIVALDTVLATNTSSLSVTAIAAGLQHPGRFVGWHFFNPVPLMRVVEVVDGARTETAVGDALMALTRRLGHTPVRAKDTPGFIVNHAGRGFTTEALRILGEGVCRYIDVDQVMRDACGFRLGPFELMDLTGLDVSQPVMESIYHQYYQEPRFRPSVIAAQRYAAGLYGKKTQVGFYDYHADGSVAPDPDAPSELPRHVYISRADRDAYAALSSWMSGRAIEVARADEADLCIVMPLGHDATSAALAEDLDATKTVAVDCLYGWSKRRTLMTTPVTRAPVRELAHGLLASDGVAVTLIHDSAGFVAQRILAMIVNIAADIAQQQIATPRDIDLAVQLGLNYPNGPLALGDALGPQRIYRILCNMQESSGDPRYRPSPWLTRRARLGVSLLNEEAPW